MVTSLAVADPQTEFAAAFSAYLDAVKASRYDEAVEHAEKARRLGEEIYADDAKVMATLAFNHGVALAKAGSTYRAYPVLKEARKLMRQAYGRGSEHLVQVEASLLNAAPDDAAPGHLMEALKHARRHYPEESERMAALKLAGGTRVWWDRRARHLLREAAETFAELGNTEHQARAQFWIGKIHLGRDEHRKAAEAMTAVVELLPADNNTVLMARANLVEAYEKLGESERATEHCLAIGRTTPWTGTADYQPLFKRPPTYPRSAAKTYAEGYVLLEFAVDEMGFVRDPTTLESKAVVGKRPVPEIAQAFETAAIDAARKFRYAPKFVEGEPVAVDGIRNRIVFEMRR